MKLTNLENVLYTFKKFYRKKYYKYMYKNKRKFYKTNKFGVLVASTKNLGDDIQTLAQINLLNKMGIKDYVYIDREKLSDYKGIPVNLIMNGWFMHNIEKFPPSEKIIPIFISIHIADEKLIFDNKWFWKLYEPIGCRDEYTKKLFEKNQIKSYLSKCLTLTFDHSNEEREGIYLVDINTCDYIPKISEQFVGSIPYKNVKKIMHDIKSDTNPVNYDLRLMEANKLLEIYRRAKLVITSRLHCALPCRAFNTPVIFVHKEYNNNKRFSGLYDELNGTDGLVEFDKVNPRIDYKIVDNTKLNLKRDLEDRINAVI